MPYSPFSPACAHCHQFGYCSKYDFTDCGLDKQPAASLPPPAADDSRLPWGYFAVGAVSGAIMAQAAWFLFSWLWG